MGQLEEKNFKDEERLVLEGLLAPSTPRLRGPALHPPAPGAAAPWNPALVCADNWLVGSAAATRLHGSDKRRRITLSALTL